jgi:hypothetical protein
LIANGVAGPLPISLALDVAEILVATGRAIPLSSWVDEMIAAKRRDEYAQMAARVMGR